MQKVNLEEIHGATVGKLLPTTTKTVSIKSDGPASQFKNKYIVAALKPLQEEHHANIT